LDHLCPQGCYIDVSGPDGNWGGITLLQESDQSVHVIALDPWGSRLVYHGCANVCDDPGHWFGGSGDSAAFGSSPYNQWASAVLTDGGIQVVFTRNDAGGEPSGVFYATCPGACTFPWNWRTDSLFQGKYTVYGSWEYGYGARSTSLASDSAGGLHLLLSAVGYSGLWYGYCAGNCSSDAGWQLTRLDSAVAGAPLTGPRVIAFDVHSGLHVVYSTGGALWQASCATGCTSAGGWRAGVIQIGVSVRALAVAFDGSGGLHLAYADSLGEVTYATCGAPCGAPGTWSSVALPVRAWDLAVAMGRTSTAYLAATTDSDVALLRCAASCLNAASWQATGIASTGGGGQVSLAVDSLGRARIASTSLWGNGLQYTQMLQ
jgi:hypothetical protein